MSLVGVLAAAYVLGGWATWGIPGSLTRFSVRIAAGLYPAALIALFLGIGDLDWPLMAFYVLAFAGIVWELRKQSAGRTPVEEGVRPESWFGWSAAALAGVALALSFLHALSPLVADGPNAAFAAAVAEHVRTGFFTWLADKPHAAQQPLPLALYSLIFHGSGEKPAQLFSWALAGLACVSIFALLRRHASADAAWGATALLATTPVLFAESAELGPLLLALAFFLPALALLVDDALRGSRRTLFLAAYLAGAALTVHASAGVPSLLLSLVALRRERRARALLEYFAILGLTCLTWWLVDILQSGHAWTRPPSLGSVTEKLLFPWTAAMAPQAIEGWRATAGGAGLALGLPGALIAAPAAVCGAVGLMSLLLGGFITASVRWMLPAMAALIAAAGFCVDAVRYQRVYRVLCLLFMIGGVALQCVLLAPTLRVSIGLQSKDEYLRASVPHYAAIEFVNRYYPGETTLLFRPSGYYLTSSSRYLSAELSAMRGRSALEQLDWLQSQDIEVVLLPDIVIRRNPWLESWLHTPDRARLVERVSSTQPTGELQTVYVIELIPRV